MHLTRNRPRDFQSLILLCCLLCLVSSAHGQEASVPAPAEAKDAGSEEDAAEKQAIAVTTQRYSNADVGNLRAVIRVLELEALSLEELRNVKSPATFKRPQPKVETIKPPMALKRR